MWIEHVAISIIFNAEAFNLERWSGDIFWFSQLQDMDRWRPWETATAVQSWMHKIAPQMRIIGPQIPSAPRLGPLGSEFLVLGNKLNRAVR